MKLYGLIRFANTDTNMADKVTIQCCNYNDKDYISEQICTVYEFDKVSCKMLNRKVNNNAYLSYTNAIELLNDALAFDKKYNEIICAEFVFDTRDDNKAEFRVAWIEKNIFPLPRKNITYLPSRIYINITSHISGKDLLSVTEASVYASHLNNVAVNCGYVCDKLFEHSCGRVLMMADYLLRDNTARDFIKLICKDSYKTIKHMINKPARCKLSTKKDYQSKPFDNDNYTNNFVKAHNLVAKRMMDARLFDVLYNPADIRDLISKEMQVFAYEYERDYYKSLVNNINDYSYISYENLLLMHVDADLRVNLTKLAASQRKIYNANKSRGDFVAIVSDGRLIYR